MKNFFILVPLVSITFFSACSQKNPPENVKKEFFQKFTDARSVKWDSEKSDEWEAEFNMGGKKMSACFDTLSVWIDTETEISEKELPAAVLNKLNAEFAGYKKGLIEIFESPEVNGFEIGLKNGERSIEVLLDNSGRIIKKPEVKEEEEKENEKEEQ